MRRCPSDAAPEADDPRLNPEARHPSRDGRGVDAEVFGNLCLGQLADQVGVPEVVGHRLADALLNLLHSRSERLAFCHVRSLAHLQGAVQLGTSAYSGAPDGPYAPAMQRRKVASPMWTLYPPLMGEQVAEYHRRVAGALKAVRDYLVLTQVELAEAGETSSATISRYETERASEVQATILVRIEENLDLPPRLLVNPPATADEVKEALAKHRASRRAERRPH
jgi:DNA-binding XRE family transcriptional regulator